MKALVQNPTHLRKTVLGWCMVLAPPLSLAAALAHPKNEHDTIQQLAVVKEGVDVWYLSHILNFGTITLLIGATLGVAHLLRERQWGWGFAGTALSLFGLLGTAGYIAVHGFVTWRAATFGDASMGRFLEHVWASPGVIGPILVVGGMLGAGTALLAIGLFRAGIVPTWAALCLTLSPMGVALGGPDILAINLLVQGGAVLLIASLTWLGIRVLRWSDDEWDRPPVYERRSGRALPGAPGPAPAERTTA